MLAHKEKNALFEKEDLVKLEQNEAWRRAMVTPEPEQKEDEEEKDHASSDSSAVVLENESPSCDGQFRHANQSISTLEEENSGDNVNQPGPSTTARNPVNSEPVRGIPSEKRKDEGVKRSVDAKKPVVICESDNSEDTTDDDF